MEDTNYTAYNITQRLLWFSSERESHASIFTLKTKKPPQENTLPEWKEGEAIYRYASKSKWEVELTKVNLFHYQMRICPFWYIVLARFRFRWSFAFIWYQYILWSVYMRRATWKARVIMSHASEDQPSLRLVSQPVLHRLLCVCNFLVWFRWPQYRTKADRIRECRASNYTGTLLFCVELQGQDESTTKLFVTDQKQ